MTRFWHFLVMWLCVPPLAAGEACAEPPKPPIGAVHWKLTGLDQVGGHRSTILGAPQLIDSPPGKAVEFGGTGDAVFLDVNPVAGLSEFTVEVVFRPSGGGLREQRFLHFQEAGSENRLLFELRLTNDNRWFLDTFIKSGAGNYTLYAENSPHPLGPWYHAALVVDGVNMRHYVNGAQERSTPITFRPQDQGRTSIGVRINQVSWYKGAIREIKVTPKALSPNEFLTP